MTALVPRASAVEAGLDSTALSLTVEAYIIVLARVNAWDQMSANVNQDLRQVYFLLTLIGQYFMVFFVCLFVCFWFTEYLK